MREQAVVGDAIQARPPMGHQARIGNTMNQMYCRSCGYNLASSTRVCPECGTAFDADEQITFDAKPPPSPLGDFGRTFLVGFAIAGGWAITFFFLFDLLSHVVPENVLAIALFGAPLLVYLPVPFRFPRFGVLAGSAFGLCWGLLIVMSALVSIQNGRLSVNWPTFLPALLIIPAGMLLISTPILLLRRWARARRIRAVLGDGRPMRE